MQLQKKERFEKKLGECLRFKKKGCSKFTASCDLQGSANNRMAFCLYLYACFDTTGNARPCVTLTFIICAAKPYSKFYLLSFSCCKSSSLFSPGTEASTTRESPYRVMV